MAHLLEHICFLGSIKRRMLGGTGARSNALTDFQHTVYHVHAPVARESGADLLIPALEALQDVAFGPRFLPERLEQERKAVLNEMQQVNTLEYRIETWTLSGLHWENQLGRRFPIGLEEQIRSWSLEECKAYHSQWYHPGNATLYLVGDVPEDHMLESVERVFASTPAKELSAGSSVHPAWGPEAVDPTSLFRRRLPTPRPKHLHAFSVPQVGTDSEFTAAFDDTKGGAPVAGPVNVIRNELLTNVEVYLYAKSPVRPVRTVEDLRYSALLSMVVNVLRVRILVVLKYGGHNASVELDHSDSYREGCAVTSLKVAADPRDWHDVLCKVVREVRAIVDHGITDGELQRFSAALEKQADTLALEAGSISSEDLVTNLMSSDVFGHVVAPTQSISEFQSQILRNLTLDEVKAAAEWMLGFVAHYGRKDVAPATAVVMCMPKQVSDQVGGQPVQLPTVTEDALRQLLRDVPDKDPEEALNPVEIPEALCPEEKLQVLLGSNYVDKMRAFLAGARRVDPDTGVVQLRLPNNARVNYAHTQNTSLGSMRLLFPGGRAAEQPDEVGAAALGARALEESGTVADFTNQQVELFAVTTGLCVEIACHREHTQVDCLYPVSDKDGLGANLQLLHLLLREPRWELPTFERAQQACRARGQEVFGSLELATEEALLSAMYPTDQRVLEASPELIDKLSLSQARACIEQQLFERLGEMEITVVQDFQMLGRALSPARGKAQRLTNDEGEAMTEEEYAAETAKMRERAERELEEGLWRFLGSLESRQSQGKIGAEASRPFMLPFESVSGATLPDSQRRRQVHLRDPEERAVAIVGGGAPNLWGHGDAQHAECMARQGFRWDWDEARPSLTKHKLYPSVCMRLLKEVLTSRLNGTVRERMGLAYSLSFEFSEFNIVQGGWFQATVSSHPARIEEALAATKRVVLDVRRQPISSIEVSGARQYLQRRLESDMHTNEYWVSLLSFLQTDDANKDISCVRDVVDVLQQVGSNDVNNAYKALLAGEDQLFVAVGTQGPLPH